METKIAHLLEKDKKTNYKLGYESSRNLRAFHFGQIVGCRGAPQFLGSRKEITIPLNSQITIPESKPSLKLFELRAPLRTASFGIWDRRKEIAIPLARIGCTCASELTDDNSRIKVLAKTLRTPRRDASQVLGSETLAKK